MDCLADSKRSPRCAKQPWSAFACFTRKALTGWKADPVFQPYFHETGFVVSGSELELTDHAKHDIIESSEGGFVPLKIAQDFRGTMPPNVLTGDFPAEKDGTKVEAALEREKM